MIKVNHKEFVNFMKNVACDPVSVVADHCDPQQLIFIDRFTFERIGYSCIYFKDDGKDTEFYILKDYYKD